MKKIITYDNLRNFAYSNDKLINKPIRAIAIDFMGWEVRRYSMRIRKMVSFLPKRASYM